MSSARGDSFPNGVLVSAESLSNVDRLASVLATIMPIHGQERRRIKKEGYLSLIDLL